MQWVLNKFKELQSESWSFGWAFDTTRWLKKPSAKDIQLLRQGIRMCYDKHDLSVVGGGGSGSSKGQAWVKFSSEF